MKYLQEFDWAATPLGARENWSPSLSAIYDLMMASQFAMFATWGPQRTFIYNAAYRPFLGARHPAALGKRIEDVWPEVWSDIGPLVERAESGEAVYLEDMHLVMTRNGFAEDTWWTFSYSPLRDDGKIMGILDVATDRTETVLLREAMLKRTEQLVESEARLLKLTTAGAYSLFRMNPSWTLMRHFEGTGILDGVPMPNADWLEIYIDEQDQPAVLAAIETAVTGKTNFELEHRVKATDGRFRWVVSRAVPILDDGGEVLEWFGAATDISARRKAEEQQDVINKEISHRLKNNLSVVQSIVSQTMRHSPDMMSANVSIASRLAAIARAQDLLLSGATDSIRLHRVIASALKQHVDDSDRIMLSGSNVEIGPMAALNLTLTMNELATNALKYGALSVPDGKVKVAWQVTGIPLTLQLRWEESGGPPVVPPSQKGFGSRLTERSLVGGESSVNFDPDGLVFTLEVPLSRLLES